jgi:DNA-directed RNA polymerase subunit RPC12/RpoP
MRVAHAPIDKRCGKALVPALSPARPVDKNKPVGKDLAIATHSHLSHPAGSNPETPVGTDHSATPQPRRMITRLVSTPPNASCSSPFAGGSIPTAVTKIRCHGCGSRSIFTARAARMCPATRGFCCTQLASLRPGTAIWLRRRCAPPSSPRKAPNSRLAPRKGWVNSSPIQDLFRRRRSPVMEQAPAAAVEPWSPSAPPATIH